MHFVMALPFTFDFSVNMIEEAKKCKIKEYKWASQIGSDTLYMMSFLDQIMKDCGHINAFVYYNKELAFRKEEEMNLNLSNLQKKIDCDPISAISDKEVG